MRDEVLLDYLLQQLPEPQARLVEKRLQCDVRLAERLERLRRRLRPLEQWRRQEVMPPAGLAERTLARIQAWCFAPLASLPRAPRAVPELQVLGGRFRLDWLVAAAILLLVGGLFLSAVGNLRARSEWLTCQNVLRQWYVYQHHVTIPPGMTSSGRSEVVTEPLSSPGAGAAFTDHYLMLLHFQTQSRPMLPLTVAISNTPLLAVAIEPLNPSSTHSWVAVAPNYQYYQKFVAPEDALYSGDLSPILIDGFCSPNIRHYPATRHAYSQHALCAGGNVLCLSRPFMSEAMILCSPFVLDYSLRSSCWQYTE
ncbi:MAG: hypothetical protein NZU63_08890 [Gemmataceae bacterium]|nr:hypothetical protein [Gemmataceae bacterium]MDW8244300.1 hypothetical protein [Thermogemmata sp.]